MDVTTFSQCRIVGFSELGNQAKKYYRRKCDELMKLGLLKTFHLQSLLLWADSYAMYWQLRKEIESEGRTFNTKNKFGDVVVSANPKVKMMNDALKQASAIAAEFGLTPKAGKRLKGEGKQQKKSALEAFNDEFGE